MSFKTLPNLIVIGGMKCGSTSLHDYLNKHPEIFMSEIKELDFFIEDRNYSKGLEWYKNQFDNKYKINGESSQNYTKRHFFPRVIDKIENDLDENCKFIFIARDPLKRFVSHIKESLSNGTLNYDYNTYFSKVKIEENYHVLCSMYYYQLKPYYDKFGEDRIKIVTLEDLNKNPLKIMNELFLFLGVKSLSNQNFFNEVKNSGSTKIRQNKIGILFSKNPIIKLIKSLIPNKLRTNLSNSKLYKSFSTEKVKDVNIDEELILKIKDIVSIDAKKFAKLTKTDISKWDIE